MKLDKKQIFSRLGNFLEWYDFSLFGYTAPIFAAQFFGTLNGYMSIVATFLTFAIGFICRPFGGLIIGYIADNGGRVKAINFSIYLMMISSLLVGLLPNFASIGIMAPILLLSLRVLQGFSTGGQFTSALVYSVENASQGKRGRVASLIWQGGTLGFLAGSLLSTIAAQLTSDVGYKAYGWRIPYLISAVTLISYYIFTRRNDIKSLLGDVVQKTKKNSIIQVLLTIKQNSGLFFRVFLLAIFSGVIYYLLLSYMITYMHVNAGLPIKDAILINTICLLVQLFTVPFFGYLSDKIGRKPLMITGIVLTAGLSYFAFSVILQGNFITSLLTLLGLCFCGSAYIGSVIAVFIEIFPKDIRCTASSLSYDSAMGFFGGTSPAIVAWLQHVTENHLAPVWYIIATAGLALIVSLTIKETSTLRLAK